MTNKLQGTRCYLAGPIDHAADHGTGWRRDMRKFLAPMGVICLDPTDKKLVNMGHEAALNEDVQISTQLRDNKNWMGLQEFAQEIRHIDLRMVDISDFMIVYIDPDIQMCGTFEELFTSNRQKKPIILVHKGGLERCSLWIFGTLPLHYIMSNFDEAKQYLECIDSGLEEMDGRWTLLDYEALKEL